MYQFIGIVLMIISITCMGIKLEEQEQENVDTTYIYWALLTGMAAPVFMSTKHVCIKLFKANYEAIPQAIDGFLLEYTLFSFITIYLLTKSDDEYEFKWLDFAVGTGAGCLMCTGRALIAYAV